MCMSDQLPREFSPNIGAYNDVLASMYDAETQAEGWAVNDLIVETMRSKLSTDIHAALDLGAGTGQTTQIVDNLFHPRDIVAVDASRKMLEQLKSKLTQPKIQVVHSTIEDYIHDSDQTFDLITAMGSLEFVKDLPRVLGKLTTLLALRGTMLLTYIPQTDPDVSERTFQVPSFKTAFTEYYWPANIIESTLASKGLIIDAKNSFGAYQRGAETVSYNFIAASKPSAD